MNVDEDFAEFVAARWASLYELAYLLAASPTDAQALMQTTLEKAYATWSRIGPMELPEAHVRGLLAHTLVSCRRHTRVGERPSVEWSEAVEDSAEGPFLDRNLYWPLVCALPARERAVIVLRYFEDLTEAQTAGVLGCSTGTVKVESSAAFGGLGRALAASGIKGGMGDQQLRAALRQAAGMHYAPVPDVGRLIRGGRVRQRRRRLGRVGLAAAAAMLIAGGVYGITKFGPSLESDKSATVPQPYLDQDMTTPIEPGTYRMLVGVDTAGVAIDADITFDRAGWGSGNFPLLYDSGSYGGVAVYQPLALAAGTGCLSDEPNRHVGRTPHMLARQLAQLPQSTVVQPPTPTETSGHQAIHLRLQIKQDCPSDVYRVADTLRGGHGISYGSAPVIIDFWVEVVGGVSVVVESWHEQGSPSQMVNQIANTVNTITFVTRK